MTEYYKDLVHRCIRCQVNDCSVVLRCLSRTAPKTLEQIALQLASNSATSNLTFDEVKNFLDSQFAKGTVTRSLDGYRLK